MRDREEDTALEWVVVPHIDNEVDIGMSLWAKKRLAQRAASAADHAGVESGRNDMASVRVPVDDLDEVQVAPGKETEATLVHDGDVDVVELVRIIKVGEGKDVLVQFEVDEGAELLGRVAENHLGVDWRVFDNSFEDVGESSVANHGRHNYGLEIVYNKKKRLRR
jgi:hypothetical protein